MKWPWKKIGAGLRTALDIGAMLNPKLKKIDDAIDQIEERLPNAPGAHKLETFQVVTDVVLESDLAKLTPDEQLEAKALRDEYSTLGVRMRNDATRALAISKRFDELFKD